MSLNSVGYHEVDAIVSQWSTKYQYHISLIESQKNMAKFMVEFSLTKPEKPIPVGTVRVYFTCELQDQMSITFRFEKDSLIHWIDKTIRNKQIQVLSGIVQKWIDDMLDKKLLVRQAIFYLGTTYEQTRVQDERLNKLLEVPKVIEEEEYVFIDPDLLSDQLRSIQIMEKSSKNQQSIARDLRFYFGEIDRENIGVVTRPQFLKIIENLGLKLTEKQKQQLLVKADKENTGVVEFKKYEQIASEVLEAKAARNDAQIMLQTKKQQSMFSAVLSLINDDVQSIDTMIDQYFTPRDEDETKVTNISQVKIAFQGFNKKFKDENKAEPLSPIEMAQIAKILTDTYGYKSIPYRQIHSHIINYKIKAFSLGLINAKMTKLEMFIREICDKYDDKKFGRIKVTNLIDAIQKSKKILLTTSQVYLLQSILPADSKGELSYIETSKFLAEIIKKFYIHSHKKKVIVQ